METNHVAYLLDTVDAQWKIVEELDAHVIHSPKIRHTHYTYYVPDTKLFIKREHTQGSRRNRQTSASSWAEAHSHPLTWLTEEYRIIHVLSGVDNTLIPYQVYCLCSLWNLQGLGSFSLNELSHLLREGSQFHEGESFVLNLVEWIKEVCSLANGSICAEAFVKS